MLLLYITGADGSNDPRYGVNYVRRGRKGKRRNHPHHSSDGEQFTEAESEAHPDTDYVPEPEIQEENEAPEVEVEEEEAQRNATARPKPRAKKAAGASHNKTLNDLSEKDFRELRRINQYDQPRSPQYDASSYFHTEFQERTLKEVIMKKDRLFVEQKHIDINQKVQQNAEYFGEAKEICEELGLIPLMKYINNYDPTLIAQFYATAYFSAGENKSFTWMSRNEQCSATLAEFAALLGYQVIHDADPGYFRCHSYGRPLMKDALAPLYMEGDVTYGEIKYLQPTWDIMNRIFRDTVAPKVGNVDQIHGYQVDLLVNTHKNHGKGLRLDVMDFIWNEMTLVATQRRVPSFCPYIMALIVDKSQTVKAALPTLSLVKHKQRGLIIKDHPAPPGAPAQDLDDEIDPGLFRNEEAPMRSSRSRRGSRRGKEVAEPEASTWAKRLQATVHRLLCLTSDVNDRQYEAYRTEKLQRQRFNEYMRSQGQDVPAGSEMQIQEREQWRSPYYADDATSFHREPAPQRQTSRRAQPSRHTQHSRPSYADPSDDDGDEE